MGESCRTHQPTEPSMVPAARRRHPARGTLPTGHSPLHQSPQHPPSTPIPLTPRCRALLPLLPRARARMHPRLSCTQAIRALCPCDLSSSNESSSVLCSQASQNPPPLPCSTPGLYLRTKPTAQASVWVASFTAGSSLSCFTPSRPVVLKSHTPCAPRSRRSTTCLATDGRVARVVWVQRRVWAEEAIEPTVACQQLEQLLEVPPSARRGNTDVTQLSSNLLDAHRHLRLRHPLHARVVSFQRRLLQAANGAIALVKGALPLRGQRLKECEHRGLVMAEPIHAVGDMLVRVRIGPRRVLAQPS